MMETGNKLSRRKFMKTLLMASSAAAIDWTGLDALADSIPKKENHPVVVIGAGLGGLVSAAYLTKFGFDVTLLEQHRIPGGYATSFRRKNGKYCFDVSLHATVAEHAMPQMILSDLGVWDHLKVVATPELRRIMTPKFDVTLPAKNPTGVKAELSAIFPHEKKGIYGFYTEMEAVITGLWQRNKDSALIMEKLEKISLKQWMEMHVKDPDVEQFLAIYSGYYGLGPSKLNALFYAIATGEFLVHGGQYYKTRSQDLSDTLARAIAAKNGKIQYRTKVDRILLGPDNEIEAVKDTKGHVYAAKSVIANCSVPVLANTMLPPSALPASYKADLDQHTRSLSSFVVWLGLKADVRHRVKTYETVLLQGDKGLDTTLQMSKDLGESSLSVICWDKLFDGYSRSGTTTMSIMCLSDYERWRKFEIDYFKGRKKDYQREKRRIAARFVKRVEERLLPGLGDVIEVMEIGTPLTNLRYTGNPGGAIYGFDRDRRHLKSRTPVKGLYLASAWSHGGGYTPVMMAGREAAKALLKDFRG